MLQLIDELDSCATLILGSQSALLFDNMSGLGDYIKSITSLPVTLINSHIHFDHNGGNHNFESTFISPLDIPYNVFDASCEERVYLADCLAEYSHDFSQEQRDEILKSEFTAYLPLEESRIFKLGVILKETVR